MKNLFILFSAGCLGGLANSMAVWLAGYYGLTLNYGVNIAPALSPEWLYPRIVWGGIWGMLFLLPLLKEKPLINGIVLSAFPTIVQLFIIFPYVANKGIAGIDLGQLTPVFVIGFNLIWGLVTAYSIRWTK